MTPRHIPAARYGIENKHFPPCSFCIAALPYCPLCNRSKCPIFNSTKRHTHREDVTMAFAANITNARGNGLSAIAANVVASVKEAAARRRVFKQTFNELQSLSNRELADLGINRSMIRSIALEAANAK